jgi:flagellar protein FlhE
MISIRTLLGLSLLILLPSANANDSPPSSIIRSYQSGEIEPAIKLGIEPTPFVSGSWNNNANGPTLYTMGVWETLQLNKTGTVTTNDKITFVNYTWDLSNWPSNLIVYLCYESNNNCADVSRMKSGSLDLRGQGYAADKPWIFFYQIPGTGAVNPVSYGRNNQVIVNYE